MSVTSSPSEPRPGTLCTFHADRGSAFEVPVSTECLDVRQRDGVDARSRLISPIAKKKRCRKRAVEKRARAKERSDDRRRGRKQKRQTQCAFLPWCMSCDICSSTTRREPAIGRAAWPRGTARRLRQREKKRSPTSLKTIDREEPLDRGGERRIST